MFGSKSVGIVEELVSALPFAHTRRGHGRNIVMGIAPESPGVQRHDETYIAPTQFTVVAMPFFRWSQ